MPSVSDIRSPYATGPSSRAPARQPPTDPAGRLVWSLACALAGGLLALAAGWPGPVVDGDLPQIDHTLLARWAWLIQGLGLALFCRAISAARSPRRVLLLATVFGLAWQGGTVWWLYIALHKYAGLSTALALAALAALNLYLTAWTVLGTLVWTRLWRPALYSAPGQPRPPRLSHWAAALVFAATWLLADLARSLVMTGFPWAASGHAHLHGPLRGLLPWVGVYGVGAMAAWAVAMLVLPHQVRRDHEPPAGAVQPPARRAPMRPGTARRLQQAVLLLVLGLAWAAPGQTFTQSAGGLSALLLQPNISQEGKFDAARVRDALNWHLRVFGASSSDISIAPETAIPVLERSLPAEQWERIRRRAQVRPGAILFGMPQGVGPDGYLNAMLGLGHADSLVDAPADGIYRYHKTHLVPFGEFTPPGFGWFTRLLDLPLPAFEASTTPPQPLQLRTSQGSVQRLAPLVCFEDLFGDELARRFQTGLPEPTVLVNGSNMAWFDDSPAIAQHLRIAQLRSLEFERPTLRATNTGATVLIDHHGVVRQALPPRIAGSLPVQLEGRSGLTPYARWVSATGLWPLVGLGGLVVLVAVMARWVGARAAARLADDR